MPTRSDITVVNAAHNTSGNGGRKLIRLKNGIQVAAVFTSTNYILYKTTDEGLNWSVFYTGGTLTSIQDVSLATDGIRVYLLLTYNNVNVMCAAFNSNGTNIHAPNIDTSQSALGTSSIIANETGTELHAAWSSKNSTYPNSFNIRYIKGTINADGSVTWGSVTQVTTTNVSGIDNTNPSIVIKNNNLPVILFSNNGGGQGYIYSVAYNGSSWGNLVTIYNVAYTQSSPSAIFVPQSINGLANGRIWVAWHGTDSTDTSASNIRVSYSDDGGVTWSAMAKLSTGNSSSQSSSSITANKANEIFVLWWGNDGIDSYADIRMIKNTSGTWGSISTISAGTAGGGKLYPSALFDITMNFSSPLFVYQHASTKVGFYGTWTVTTISVPEGSIGNKTISDLNNLLTYSITTDGTMSTVTEKVNGTVVGTKTLTSGQSTSVSLTQSQWDSLKYGKYKDAVGGLKTLTIEMGSDVWNYTFDKRLSSNDTSEQIIQANSDVANIFIPSVKTKLSSSIVAKGSTTNVTSADSWDTLNGAINTLGKKPMVVTATSSAATNTFTFLNGATQTNNSMITVTGLPSKPIFIYAFWVNGAGQTSTSVYSELAGDQYPKTVKVTQVFSTGNQPTVTTYHVKGDVAPVSVTNGTFTIPVYMASSQYTCLVFF